MTAYLEIEKTNLKIEFFCDFAKRKHTINASFVASAAGKAFPAIDCSTTSTTSGFCP